MEARANREETIEELEPVDVNEYEDESEEHVGAPVDALNVRRSITILGEPAELHAMYRAPENLAMIMAHFATVVDRGEGRTRWMMDAPLGRTLEWDSQITEDRPGEMLAWRSLPGADMPNEGSINFRSADGRRGTVATLHFRFDPPGGVIGDAAMKLFHVVPELMISKALRRFKSLAETGEVPTSKLNPRHQMQDAKREED